ncbi:nucleotidyltransferase [Paenibacillaceae bacterium]|nr:nucleotidyltransferase [Paenibacillaceae bacterium]
MRTVGLIVEYNPFHNGHAYHLQQSVKITEADAVVAVMSGSFLQRGEPALLDKWTRAEMALHGGCDLVIELPTAYATQPAEWFAFGAVSLLKATGVVDSMCFGSESGSIASLSALAAVLAEEPERFQELLRASLRSGSSYPAAYSSAVQLYMTELGEHEAASYPLAQPNNTLALHYLIALRRLNSRIRPYTIVRQKAGYSQQDVADEHIASATALRRMLSLGQTLEELAPFVPATTLHLLQREGLGQRPPTTWETFMPKLLHQLLSHSPTQLAEFHEISEGLEHRLAQAVPRLESLRFEALMQALKTRRYTRTKLQRALLALLLNHRKDELHPDRLQSGIDYIRVLGFTDKGRQLLKKMKTTARLPVLHSAAQPPRGLRYLELDVRASAVYALAAAPDTPAAGLLRDYYERPIII